jgi:lysophospholipase L1-like esterase
MYKVTAVGNSGAPYQFTTVPATNGPITFTAEVGSDDGTSKTVSVGANCNATCLKVRCWREDGGKVTLRPPSMCYTTVSGSQRVRMGLTYWIDGAAQTTVYPQLIPGMWSENLGSAALFGDAQLELTEYPTPFVPANLADGTSNVDLVSLTDSLPITSWAIAAMATPGGRSVWWQPTVRYLASRGTAGANNSASLYIDTSNHAVLDVIDGSGNHSTATSGYLSIPPGKSALISGYWSGAPGIAIDGSIVPVTLSGAGIGLQSAPSSIYLGSGDGSGTGAWGGQIAGFQTCKKGVSTCGSSLARPAVPVSYFIGCIGDSMTFGQGLAPWPTTLGTLLGSSYVTYNYGVSGETSAQMLTRWTSTYRYTARSHITFLGGINEVVFGNGVQVWPNIKTITDQAVADGVRVVLLTLLPFKGSGGWTAGNQSDLEAINANIRAYASPPAVVVVDTYTAMGGADPLYLNAAYDSGDHFHPNQAGADVIAALVAAAIVP